MTEPEPTVQVPVSLIERARLVAELNGSSAVRDDLDALLSQQAPTAVPCICGPQSVISDGPNTDCPVHGERVESPRIEDMAPGTTFTEEVRWTVTGTLSTGATVAHSDRGEMRFADRFDPSTIRDVTPPTTEGTK